MSTTGDAVTAGPKLTLPGRGTPASAGMAWIGEGWKLFVKAPLMWIVAIIILVVIAVLMSFIPIIGSIAFQVLNPVFAAGLVVACRALEQGGEFELEHLFAGFKGPHLGNLVIVGLLFLVGSIAIILVVALFAGFGAFMAVFAGETADAGALMASGVTLLLAVLVMLALMVPLVAAYWFAPALVILHAMGPMAAMKESFFACFRNFIPFILYGLVMMVLAIVAAIPLGLGFLVWVPLAVTSTYAAYRQIFTEGD